jgi:hypothetical protein
MILGIRAIAKLAFVVIAITICLPIPAPRAQTPFNFAYVSATGTGVACTLAQPCGSLISAFIALGANNGRIVCLGPVNFTQPGTSFSQGQSNIALEIDCPAGMYSASVVWSYGENNVTVRIRNVTFTNLGSNTSGIQFDSYGTLILENCIFEGSTGIALDIEPNGPLNLVIRNSRVSSSAAGILLRPQGNGSINVTLDHVAIVDNSGGGLKIDTTNGPVTTDITDSVVSNNGGNGINAVGNAGGQAIVSIKNSVIAKNGVAGVQSNGVNAGVLIATTLFDQNTAGATSVVGGGNMFTYGNNDVVGSLGSGFTGTATLH